MLLIFKKVSFLVGLTLLVIDAHSQIVSSTRNGDWNDAATWTGGIIPSSVNATQVVVNHAVVVSAPSTIAVHRLVVHDQLTLKVGSALQILPDDQTELPDLLVVGTLLCEDSTSLTGTTTGNTRFEAGARYVHLQGPLGFVPLATWDANSTFVIGGFTNSGYINIAHSDGWKQSFGNVVYDCPGQTIFVVDLNGHLRNINGSLTVRNTNNQTLRLSTTQSPVINIAGDFTVEGNSEVWLGTNGTGTTVNVFGDFNYRSTSTGPSYLTTRGTTVVNIAGDLNIDTNGVIRMTSSSVDSTGARTSTFNLAGDLHFVRGGLIAPPQAAGVGQLVLGGSLQQVRISAFASILGHLEYTVETSAFAMLGESALQGQPGALTVRGTIALGSTHPEGAIQLSGNGNIQVTGPRLFATGSTIVFNAATPQTIGNGYPDDGVRFVCDNPTTLSATTDLVVGGDLSINAGSLVLDGYALFVYGDLTVGSFASIEVERLVLGGARDQLVSCRGATVANIAIDKAANSSVTLTSPLELSGLLKIESPATALYSNGHLTIASTTDGTGNNGRIGAIPMGSAIEGDVHVQRHMSGEGRIYRYIASPVRNATVASLMDDFPVTGTFTNPTTGPGISSRVPSLYFYDESVGGLQAGWRPYPTGGYADENALLPGKGYAAFIRKGVGPTTWDVTGTLNQGDISLPVSFTPNDAPSNGWNLVGNPYACTIDWDITGTNGWTKSNVSPIISVRDNGGGGFFRYWDGDVNYNDIPEGRIAAGQSIWVRATGPNPQLIAREGVKVDTDAEFFRRFPEIIPSFALALRHGSAVDRAYVKKREEAHNGYDDWDAIKQDNEGFDLAWRADDGTLIAIMATNRLLCSGSVLPIVIKDVPPGDYSFDLEKKFDYETYRFTLVDQWKETEYLLGEGREVPFRVSWSDTTGLSERFVLRVNAVKADFDFAVEVVSQIPSGEALPVRVLGSQVDVTYVVADSAGRLLAGEQVGTGKDLVIRIPTDSLTTGRHALYVKAYPDCSPEPVDTVLFVTLGPSSSHAPGHVVALEPANGFTSSTLYDAKLYPNPVHTFLTLETTELRAQCTIFSLGGSIIETPVVEEWLGDSRRMVFSVENLSPGPYILMICSGRQKEVIPFLKY
jgi:hypothetical protein